MFIKFFGDSYKCELQGMDKSKNEVEPAVSTGLTYLYVCVQASSSIILCLITFQLVINEHVGILFSAGIGNGNHSGSHSNREEHQPFMV